MVKKFRKKPVVIEAIQYNDTIESVAEILTFCGKNSFTNVRELKINTLEGVLKINTLEGVMTANLNDWIIKGVNGEFYPCKPGIFEKTYEEVV